MRGLGETTAILAARRRAARPADVADPRILRETSAFGANPGGLKMLSYRPEGLAAGAPLVVTLHGCGQGARDYAAGAGWLALADRLGFAVLAPEQRAENNPNRCFNWFSPRDVARGGGEVASIAAMVAFMLQARDLDLARVFVTGLSAGGAMTLAMLAAYPDRFAGGAVIAGLPYGVADDVMQAMAAMRQVDRRSADELGRLIPANAGTFPRLAVWHGEADAVVAPLNARAIAAQWALAQGLAENPSETIVDGPRTRAVWRRDAEGEALVELNLVRGLGHGVPLSTLGEEGLGGAGPYMLESGLCSSSEIARFWGLSPWSRSPEERVYRVRPANSQEASPPPAPGFGVGDRVLASLSGRVPADIQAVIAKALRSAGLSR